MPTEFVRRMIPALFVLLVGACDDITGLKLVQLAQNRALWESKSMHSYTLHQTNACFCEFGGQTFAVQVEADTITSVRFVATGETIDKRNWQTVPELFDYAERLLRTPDYKVTVAYEPSLGYPTNIDYECSRDILDCGGATAIRLVNQLASGETGAFQGSPWLSFRN